MGSILYTLIYYYSTLDYVHCSLYTWLDKAFQFISLNFKHAKINCKAFNLSQALFFAVLKTLNIFIAKSVKFTFLISFQCYCCRVGKHLTVLENLTHVWHNYETTESKNIQGRRCQTFSQNGLTFEKFIKLYFSQPCLIL